jgi:uncharacterized protein (TIGR02271 family)
MSYRTGQTAGQRTVTAFFDKRQDADEAIQRLVAEGVSRSNINIVEGAQGNTSSQEDTGFWDALKDLFLPEEDRSTYAEGLRRGGYLVTVGASNAQYERVIDILDDEGAVDLDQREAQWRAEGWTGHGRASSGSSTGAGVDRTTGDRDTTGDREAIPVVEEQLNVGKREIGGGRVRVRSYVVEQPVQEQVNLRDERVSVERRPVDRPLTGADRDRAFQERTIEAEEKSEEAVVNKEARVKEELVVNKDVNQRTETVSDTVRRTEVDVQDERGDAARRSGERKSR